MTDWKCPELSCWRDFLDGVLPFIRENDRNHHFDRERILGGMAKLGLLGISVDGAWCHLAFAKDRKIRFPLLADFEPKGEMAKALGVLHEGGFTARALVIVGPDGLVKWSYQAESTSDLPGANLIFDGLAASAAA